MGCQQSHVKGEGYQQLQGRPHINPEHLPPVPADSWYAMPFTEDTPMELTSFHAKRKGDVCFSTQLIPTRASEFAQLDTPNREPQLRSNFMLGVDPIVGLGFLHNTALYIEHYWRTRVSHTFAGDGKFDRPFYNMLLGIKVFINDTLVPDQASGPDSLLQCTATIRAHEATTTWLCLPVILCPPPNDVGTCSMLSVVEVYRGLALSFLLAAQTLNTGEHNVRVEIVYGCRAEANFCTDFIARGSFTLAVADQSSALVAPAVAALSNFGFQFIFGHKDHETVVLNRTLTAPAAPCPFCSAPLKYVCTICGANVCGSSSCVWSKFSGYPYGCQTHKAQF